MKAGRTLALLAMTLAPCFPEALTQGERDRAMSELHAARKMFLDSIEGLTQAQWNFKPSPDPWSIREIAEHITLSEDSLFDLLTKKILQLPAQPEKRGQTKPNDEQIITSALDRGKKAKAPEFLQPAGRWHDRKSLIEHFKRSRDRTITYARTTEDDLRAHFMARPAGGDLDGYQFLLLIAAHCERHVAQINEVRASANYPK